MSPEMVHDVVVLRTDRVVSNGSSSSLIFKRAFALVSVACLLLVSVTTIDW